MLRVAAGAVEIKCNQTAGGGEIWQQKVAGFGIQKIFKSRTKVSPVLHGVLMKNRFAQGALVNQLVILHQLNTVKHLPKDRIMS